MSSVVLWLAVAVVAIGVEIFTVDLTFGLIALGAASAAGAGWLGAPLWMQAVVGVGVSVAGIAVIRPLALRHMRRSGSTLRSGVDALPGSEGRAVTIVSETDGRVTLKGEVWSARLDPDVTRVSIDPGTPVVVTRIDGATALVHPID